MEAMKINFNESTNQRNFENFQRTLPSVKTGTKGWENSETLEEAILTLKKICAVSTSKKEQDYILIQIQKYDDRCKELSKYVSIKETRDEDEEQSVETNTQIEMLLWDDVQYINEELKKYQIQASEEKNKTNEKKSSAIIMIKMLCQRLNTLLKEETERHLDDENSSMPDYDKIREACDIAFYDKKEWNDLPYVHQTILELQIEQTKEPDEKQRKDIGEIIDKYMTREKNIIDIMVEYDIKLIKNGLVKFDEETGDVEMNEAIIMTNEGIEGRRNFNNDEVKGKKTEII